MSLLVNREIKFKYYFLLNEKVMYTKTFIIEDIESRNFNTMLFLNVDCTINNFENMELHRSEYTGLKDKNNVEIYEGDIVRVRGILNAVYECTFKDGAFMFIEHSKDSQDKWIGRITDADYEVIGNIYENPELLKG